MVVSAAVFLLEDLGGEMAASVVLFLFAAPFFPRPPFSIGVSTCGADLAAPPCFCFLAGGFSGSESVSVSVSVSVSESESESLESFESQSESRGIVNLASSSPDGPGMALGKAASRQSCLARRSMSILHIQLKIKKPDAL
jgi:hypothetical protein